MTLHLNVLMTVLSEKQCLNSLVIKVSYLVFSFLVRNESSPLGISLVAVALDFQVFLAQTIRLKQSNSKEPERSRCCRGGK